MKPSSLSEPERLSQWRHRCWPVVLVVGAGVVLAVVVFFLMRVWEQKSIEEAFRLAAEDRARAVKGAFETELAMMELVRSSLISDGRIERQEFTEILVPFLSRTSNIKAVEWVPRVLDKQREAFETATQRDGIEGFRISEMDKNGRMTLAPRRDAYYPVYFIGPLQSNKSVLGYDVGSEPTRLESLDLARDTGKTAASGRFAFVDEPNVDGFLVCLPVYEKDKPVARVADRRQNLMGFILGVFRPIDMIDAALAKLQPEGIDVALFDASEPASDRAVEFHASRTRPDFDQPAERSRLMDPKGLRHLVKLNVAGHPWTVVCAPTSSFETARRTGWPYAVLAAGVTFALMLAGYLWLGIGHTTRLEEKVREQTVDVRAAQEEAIFRLVSASQWRDEETGMHVQRIGLLSHVLARAAGWFGDDLDVIRQAAPMHDIGKIGIPDAILRKPGRLTPEEFEVMKTHARIGAEILADSKVPMLQMAREIALNHHERWDGTGYPRGLAGKQIPESARIVAIVDAYDAMTNDRVNRAAMSESEALAVMQQESATHFDPDLLADFFRRLPEIHRAVAEAQARQCHYCSVKRDTSGVPRTNAAPPVPPTPTVNVPTPDTSTY
jgi:HD-GYP domain-containing protein (c-di-GMP phosphodiesterase class II)/CHASE1-domain containing sensor protein